jgi:tetratricopeptide (TPR) repeat protein
MKPSPRVFLAALAVLVSPAILFASNDKKLPKRPDRPLSVAVQVVPQPAPTNEAETKAQKEVQDSLADVRESLRSKRKDWFTLVDDPAEAEILVELEGRGWEQKHGAVLRGTVRVLNQNPFKIIGQGALNPGGWSFKYWREAAGDMTARLQNYCQQTYSSVVEARQTGVRPLAVAANDRGVDQMRKDDVTSALVSFDEAIRLAPGFAMPHFNRGLALAIKKDWPGALVSYDAALKIDPGYRRGHYFRAEARRENGDMAGSRTDLDEAIRQDPRHADAWLDRASTLSALGEHKAAIDDYDQVIALDPKQKGRALARQGLAWERLGDTPRALAAYEAAAALGTAEAALHYNLGRLLAASGSEAKACVAFGEAASLDARDADILLERGVCRAKRGQVAQAIDDFSEAVRLKPDMAAAWYNRSLCYTKQGKAKMAASDKARAIKLDPKVASRK